MSKLFLACLVVFAALATLSLVEMVPTHCCNLDTNYMHIADTDDNCKYYYCYNRQLYPYNCTASKRVPDKQEPTTFSPCTQDKDLANNEQCKRSSPSVNQCTPEKQKASGTYYDCLSCNCQLDGIGGDPKCCNATGANLALLKSEKCSGFCYVNRQTGTGGVYLQRGCSKEFPNIDPNVGKNCKKQQLYGADFFWFCSDGDNCNNKHTTELCPGL